ncbi:MAG: hypothetical protein ACYTG7_09090 [Planctomycetota bacterium]|jgi:hypothetical protein
MFQCFHANRINRFILPVLLLLLFLASCNSSSPRVCIGPPQDRYDHNRTLFIGQWTYKKWTEADEPENMILELDRLAKDAVYTPIGDDSAPRAFLGEDGLPAASLVPIYTGVPLPLSKESAGETSDLEDLIDFLGSGPLAHQGVETPEMAGALPDEQKAKFQAMIDLLASESYLADRKRVVAWAKKNKVEWTFDIIDARYPAAAFSDRMAILYEDFWFVLFSPINEESFTRLVVVPAEPTGDWDKKPLKGGES